MPCLRRRHKPGQELWRSWGAQSSESPLGFTNEIQRNASNTLARVYQKSRRTTNPSEAVVRWATKTLPADTKFVSFFATFAVEVTATMLFIFNISTIVVYSFFIASGNAISNVSSNLYAE